MRRWALAAAGIAGSLAIAQAVPPGGSPGLRGMLVALPCAAALVLAAAHALGARRPRADEVVAALAALGVAAGAHRAGFDAGARLAVLGIFAVVALRILRLAPALARELGRERPRWSLFAALPLAAYLVFMPWADAARPPDGDEPYYLLLAESLASDLDVDLADEYAGETWKLLGERPLAPQVGDPVGEGGAIYSRHEPFLPLLLAPFWSAAGLVGARFAMLLVAAALAGAIPAATVAMGVGRRGALRAWGLAAFAPPVLLLSHQIWVELPAALLVALALVAFGRARRAGWTGRRAAAFALPLALLPLLKLRLLAVAAPLALLGFAGAGARRGARLAALVVGGGKGALLLGSNEAVWDNPLRMHSAAELAFYELPGSRFVLGGVGLFFDVAFGLFAAAPLWLLLVRGGIEAWRRRGPVALARAALVPYFLAVASRREWYGGWSPAFRYGVVALPALAAAVALACERRPPPAARTLVAALAALTVLVTAARVVEPGWALSLADGRSALLDLATSGYAADLVRFTPSAVRPRAATWIVPLAAVAALLLVWRGRRGPRAPASAGVAALVGVAALLLVAAHRLPTRVVEIEDPWVAKSGGGVWPGPWVTDRTRFDGGWMLYDGAAARAPVVAGGAAAVLEVRWAAFHREAAEIELEISVGERTVARRRGATSDGWRTDRVEVSDWPPGAPLVLRCAEPAGRPVRAAVVDRVEVSWR